MIRVPLRWRCASKSTIERNRSSQIVFSSRNSSASPWAAQNLRMHPDDQHFFVIGTIEDADPPAFGKPARRAPEKIVFQFFGARLFETPNLAPCRIDPGQDVPDGAVLPGSVHPLKNQQQGIAVGRIVKLLQRVQLLNVSFQKFLILLLRLEERLHLRRPLAEFDLFSAPYAEILGIDFHLLFPPLSQHRTSVSNNLFPFAHDGQGADSRGLTEPAEQRP